MNKRLLLHKLYFFSRVLALLFLIFISNQKLFSQLCIPPIFIPLINPSPVCQGGTVYFSAQNILNDPIIIATWIGPVILTGQNPVLNNAQPNHSGTYVFIAFKQGCFIPFVWTSSLQVNAPANPNPTNNGPVCVGQQINLNVNAPNAQGVTYSWQGPNGFTSGNQNPVIPSATLANSGTYTVTVNVPGCGAVSATTTVQVVAPPNPPAPTSNSPVCAGGTLFLTATGTQGATYSWTGPNNFVSNQQNPSISQITTAGAGIYSITVSKPPCPPVTGSVQVVIGPVINPSNNGPICAGDNLLLTAAPVQGATYTWNGPNNFQSNVQNPTIQGATQLNAGTYTVTVTAPGCNPVTATTHVSVITTPNFPAPTSNTPLCAGSTLQFTITPTPGATYSWIGPNGFSSTLANPTIGAVTAAASGTYTITVSKPPCQPISATHNVTVSNPPVPNPTNNGPLCVGGTLQLTANNAGPNATYSWSGPNGFTSTLLNPTIQPVTLANDGVYTLTVTVPGCNPVTATTTVTVKGPAIFPNPTNNGPLCANQNLVLNATATPGATYQWVGPSGLNSNLLNPTFTNVTAADAGLYTLTVSVPGCNPVQVTTNVIISNPPAATATNNGPLCTGATLNLATPNAGPNATYSWTGPNAFSSTLQNPVLYAVTAANAGTYSVTVTVPGCAPVTSQTTVQILSTPVFPNPTVNSPICAGGNLNFTINTTPNATYQWTGPNGFGSTLPNPTIGGATTAATGAYTVIVSVPHCNPVSATVYAVVNNPPNPNASNNGPLCTGATLQLTSNNAGPGATYSWTGPNMFTSTLQNPTIHAVGPNNGGTYSLTVTVPGCPPVNSQTTVQINNTPVFPNPQSNSPICAGQNLNLQITPTPGATYLWSGPNGFSSTLQNPTIGGATTAYSGTYVVAVSVPQCNPVTAAINVEIYNPPNPPNPTNNGPLCAGATLQLTVATTPGATYSWSGPGSFNSTLPNPSIPAVNPSNAGTYSVTVTVPGCPPATGQTTVTINNFAVFPAPQSNSPVCVGGNLNLSATGSPGASYLWVGPNGFSSTLQNPTIGGVTLAASGDYSITVTVPQCNPITAITTVTVNAPPNPPNPSNNGPLCSGALLNLMAVGTPGATYQWTGPNNFTSTLQNPSINAVTTLEAGTYSVTVTVPGCPPATGQTTVVVHDIPIFPNPSSNSPVCTGDNITLTATGSPGASYNWNGPNGFNSTLLTPTIGGATPAASGVYTLTVTVPQCNPITAQTTVIVNDPPLPPNPTNNGPLCLNQTLNLDATFTPGASYSWSGPNNFSSTLRNPTIYGVNLSHAGTYSVTVTVPGCAPVTAQTTVIIHDVAVNPAVTSNSPVCAGDPIMLTANGTPGASYSWTGPNAFSSTLQNPIIANATPANAGIYEITVTVPFCAPVKSSTTVEVNLPPSPPNPTSNSPLCLGQTLQLDAILSPNATYSWSGPNFFSSTLRNPTIHQVSTANAGTYQVVVTVPGCAPVTGQVNVIVNDIAIFPDPKNNGPLCEGMVLNLSANASPNATYQWTGPNGFTSTLQNPNIANVSVANAGVYSITVTVPQCDPISATTTVQIFAPPNPPNPSGTAIMCQNGTILLQAVTTPGATYSWTGPNNFSSTLQNPSIPNATTAHSGTYSVTVSVPACAPVTGSFDVQVVNPPLFPAPTNSGPVCVGNDLSFNAVPSPGATYQWTGPNGFNSTLLYPKIGGVTTAANGVYTITVVVPGCDPILATTQVKVYAPAIPNPTNNGPLCLNQPQTLFLSTDLHPDATYEWVGPNQFSSTLRNPVIPSPTTDHTGTYVVTVTVPGCGTTYDTTNVIISEPPLPPSPMSNSPLCVGEQLNLTATAKPGTTLYWSGPNGFSSTLQNPELPNALLPAAGDYIVEAVAPGCPTIKDTVNVQIITAPAAPTAMNVCGTHNPVFTALMNNPAGSEIRLYTTPTGGTPFAIKNSPPYEIQAPSVGVTTTYYLASATSNGCTSTRTPVIAYPQAGPSPVIPTGSQVETCGTSGLITFTARMGIVPGTELRLYSTPYGGMPISTSSNGPNYLLQATIQNNTTTTFYIETYDANRNCVSNEPRVPVTAIARLRPAVPSAQNLSACEPGSFSFSVLMNQPAGAVARLYTVSSGGEPVAVDSTQPYILRTPEISTHTTFYIEAGYNNSNCSSARVPIVARIETVTPPVVENVLACGNGSTPVTFTATMIAPGNVLRVYTLPESIQFIHTDNIPAYTYTANVTQTATYFFTAYNPQTGCESKQRTQASAIVRPVPVFSLNPVSASRCGPGVVTVTVTVTNPTPDTEVRLYLWPGFNAPIQTTTQLPAIFTTPSITTTTSYVVEVAYTETRCEARKDFVGTIIPLPGRPIIQRIHICNSDTANITVLPGNPPGQAFRLYTQSSSSEPLWEALTVPGYFSVTGITRPVTYYATAFDGNCESAKTPVIIQPNQVSPPIIGNVERCGAGAVTFTAQMGDLPGNEIRLYPSPAATGYLTRTGVSPYFLVLNNITTTTTFYASVFNEAKECESRRIPVVATIHPLPPLPTTPDTIVLCSRNSTTLSVSFFNPAFMKVRVYGSPVGGIPIAEDDTPPFQLPINNVVASNFYYVEAVNTQTGCISATRRPVWLQLGTTPARPQANAPTRCGAGNITITATLVQPQQVGMRLYTVPSGGVPLAHLPQGPYEFTDIPVTTTTTFYLATYNEFCESVRLPLRVVVYSLPAAPQVTHQVWERCGAGAVTITATMGQPAGNVIALYQFPTGGDPLQVDNVPPFEYTLESTTTTTYYLASRIAELGCESQRTAVVVKILPTPSEPGPLSYNFCGPADFSFSITAQPGESIQLYTVSTAGAPIVTLSDCHRSCNYRISNLNRDTTLYAEHVLLASGCKSGRAPIQIKMLKRPGKPIARDVTICQAGHAFVTAAMVQPLGTELRLYETPVATVPFARSTSTNAVLQTPFNATSTLYYISSIDVTSGCESERAVVNVILQPPLPAPQASNVIRCSGIPATITATFSANIPSGTIVLLYALPVGGTVLGSDATYPYEINPPNPLANGTYYLEARDPSTGCTSPRTKVEVSFNSLPGRPANQQIILCSPGIFTFTAHMGTPSGNRMYLYSTPIGGVPISTAFSAPYTFSQYISSSITYYVAAADVVSGCEGDRGQIAIEMAIPPAAPSVLQDQFLLCQNGSVTLTANMGIPAGTEMRLYVTPRGGSPIASATTFPYVLNTPSINTTTTFYVEAINTQTGCTSTSRTPVFVQLNPSAKPGLPKVASVTLCSSAVAILTPLMGRPEGTGFYLYENPVGGSPISSSMDVPYLLRTPIITTTTTFYVASFFSNCESDRVPVIIHYDVTLTHPQVQPVMRCGVGSVTFTVQTQVQATQVRLFTTATQGVPVATAGVSNGISVITSPPIGTHTLFYVEAFNGNCSSPRTAVEARVLLPPPPPTVRTQTVCRGARLTLSIPMSVENGTEVRMYTQESGGDFIQAAVAPPYNLITPPVLVNTTFYLESGPITCPSNTRSAVVVLVYDAPAVPIPNTTRVSRCGAGTLHFTVSSAEAEVQLLDINNNILSVDATPPFILSTPFLVTTTTFYIRTYSRGMQCSSSNVEVVAEVSAVPGSPTARVAPICAGNIATIVAQMSTPAGTQITLFDAAVGGTPIATDNTPIFELPTPVLTTHTIFYIESQNTATGCSSPRVPVQVLVTEPPQAPAVGNVSVICGSGSAILTITTPQNNVEVRLYSQAAQGVILDLDSDFPYSLTTPIITTTTTFYIASAIGQCESVRRSMVVVNVQSKPVITANSVSRCSPGTVTFTAQGSNVSEVRLYVSGNAGPIQIDATPPFELSPPYTIFTTTQFQLEPVNGMCVGDRVTVSANVVEAPPMPGSPLNLQRCGPGSVSFSIAMNATPNVEVRLYDVPQGGNIIATDNVAPYELLIPFVAVSANYYLASFSTLTQCESPRVKVSVTIFDRPANLQIEPIQTCAGIVTVPINGVSSGAVVKLYTQPSGGVPIQTVNQNPYELRLNVVTNITYYVEQENGACSSARTPFSITVTQALSIPPVGPFTLCAAQRLTFTVSVPSGTEVSLFAEPIGGFALDKAVAPPYSLTTPLITTSSVFYLEARQGNCMPSARVPFSITVSAPPARPVVNNVQRCGTGRTTFTVSTSTNGATLRFYDENGIL
ncbi:MAG: hypothetical protein NZ576_03195, partial [Bacteroidia bacterium]|nr:hypothetical protein [Bacteroidia bacterium]